jgi:hypothetical protein
VLRTKKIKSGRYEIVGTPLLLDRDDAPRFGMPQEWTIVHRDKAGDPLLTGKGKDVTLRQLETLMEACAPLFTVAG